MHVIAITSMIGCNTKIVAGIFDMFNFMSFTVSDAYHSFVGQVSLMRSESRSGIEYLIPTNTS